jgi:hypothetical protein
MPVSVAILVFCFRSVNETPTPLGNHLDSMHVALLSLAAVFVLLEIVALAVNRGM